MVSPRARCHRCGVAVRALLVDDNPEFLARAAAFLASQPGLTIVGYAAAGAEAVEKAETLKPDLLLMDLAMPDLGGIEVTARVKRLADPPKVVLVSLHDTPEYREAARRAGADSFVSKDHFAEAILLVVGSHFPEASAVSLPAPENQG